MSKHYWAIEKLCMCDLWRGQEQVDGFRVQAQADFQGRAEARGLRLGNVSIDGPQFDAETGRDMIRASAILYSAERPKAA